jgi:aspartyl-tRNA(Asn)/glutamyl-tRNA(Gln) amidotransferase subunit B
MINKLVPHCQEHQLEISNFPVSATQLADFIRLIDEGKVSNTIAYQRLFPALVAQPKESPSSLAEQLNLLQSSDADFLEGIAKQVLADFPDKVAAYQKGKKGLLGFFMGQLMKRSKGKADPKAGNELLRKLLG